jgi:hypothetical protein
METIMAVALVVVTEMKILAFQRQEQMERQEW